jgi:carboxymethylenebutenolidase
LLLLIKKYQYYYQLIYFSKELLMELTTSAGEVFNTYQVGPKSATKAILIIHDWWGMLDYNREWADQFAQQGYRAMVIDLYQGHHPTDVKAAGEYMRTLNQQVNQRKLQTALTHLRSACQKIAILGWSYGGLQAQHAALQFPELVDALIIYYCRIILDKNNVSSLKGPVLAIFAERERTWPDKQVSLELAMTEAGKHLTCQSYDADHGFVNPESPRYDSEVTEEAWQVTLKFLDKHLS